MENSTNSYAPVIIPTLNRYEHFKRCLESLEKCTGAEKTDVYVALDYPPSNKYVNGWQLVDAYLKSKADNNRFKNLFVIRRERNYGIGKKDGNYESLLEEIKKVSDRYIFSEDDNEFSPNFLEYINWGLSEFENDEKVLAVCGFKRIDCTSFNNNVYKYKSYNAWGAGFWFRSKEKLDKYWDLDVIKDILNSTSIFKAFTKKAYILSCLVSMLNSQKILADVIPSLLSENERWCIFPTISKIRNHGHDGSGLHGGTHKQLEFYTNMPIDTEAFFIPHIVEDLYSTQIEKIYRKTYWKYTLKMQLYGTVVFFIFKSIGMYLTKVNGGKWRLIKI
jgi:hypothetical protein